MKGKVPLVVSAIGGQCFDDRCVSKTSMLVEILSGGAAEWFSRICEFVWPGRCVDVIATSDAVLVRCSRLSGQLTRLFGDPMGMIDSFEVAGGFQGQCLSHRFAVRRGRAIDSQ